MNFNNTFQLFINGEEYDFEDEVKFYFHPTNFSSFTLNNVVKKSNNNWPNITNAIDIQNEFAICELKLNGETFFIGIINDVGRLSLMPNKPKTFSLQIADFRKWLSLTKPLNEIYINKTPSFIVQNLITKLNEPKIKVGQLNFTTTNDFTIKAYNTTNKTLYQILKDVIERQTNSVLYFTVENGIFYINYKSVEDFKNTSPLILDINDENFLLNYKIEDINYDNETNDYYNYLAYSSDNVISKMFIKETNLSLKEDKIVLLHQIGKIIEGKNNTYFYNPTTQDKIIPTILTTEEAKEGKFCHLVWSEGSNALENRFVSSSYVLNINYKIKQKLTLEAKNLNEINRLKALTGTKGIVYKSEKFNDISDPDDLLAAVKNDLEKYSYPNKILTINAKENIWKILDTVIVTNINENINGKYIVQQMEGSFKRIKGSNTVLKDITYVLKQTRNFNTLENKFDNQSYRDLPATSSYTIEEADTIVAEHLVIFETNILEINTSRFKEWR